MSDNPYLPCPFCGSADIDPAFWSNGDGISGPGCMQCGATSEADGWNKRTLNVDRLVDVLFAITRSLDLRCGDQSLVDAYRAGLDIYLDGNAPDERPAFRALVLAALGIEEATA